MRPRPAISSTSGRAWDSQPATVKGSLGSARSSRWCGTARRSAELGLAVPTDNPRKSWRESATRISIGSHVARAIASSDLPEAVGPRMAAIGGAAGARRPAKLRPGTRRPAAGAIGLVDLHEALDLLDRGRSTAGAVRLDHHGVEHHRPLPHLEPRWQMSQEAGQHGLHAEPDDRIARAGHSQVADIGGAAWQEPGIGGGDVGVGTDHRADATVQVPAHRVLLAGDLAVKVHEPHGWQWLGGSIEERVRSREWRVELVHVHATHQVDDCHLTAVGQVVHQPSASGRIVWVVQWAQDWPITLQVVVDLALLPDVVA